jgi:hypothetical protein
VPFLIDVGVIIFKELSGAILLKLLNTFVMLNRSTVNGRVFITNSYSFERR